MRRFRHDALDIFFSKTMPTWGADLSGIDFDDIYYYLRPAEKQGKSWDDVPEDTNVPSTASASPKRNAVSSQASALSTSRKSSTTA